MTTPSLTLIRPLALALLGAVAGSALAAGDDDWSRYGRDVDPDTFVVGHPASPRWQVTHANHEHPAVVAARYAKDAAVDPNTFLVQPPAQVTWRERGVDEDARSVAAVPMTRETQAR